MRTFYLIRHGQTEWNRLEKKQGHVDIPMNQTGFEQAEEIRPLVQTLNIERVISSDLIRATETARTIFPDALIESDSRLREVHIEGGENEDLAVKRLEDCLQEWFSKAPDTRFAFVTHGMLMRLFAQRCLRSGFREDLRAPNCAVYQFHHRFDGFRLHQIFHR